MITSRSVANGKIRTAYLEAGNGTGTPFVLVHGFTGSKLDFRDQMPWFADTRRVIAPDQRGHGESSHQVPYSLDVLTTDLLGFLDILEIPRCHLLGHSMGGMVAIRFALAQPERLASLILMDTAAEPLSLFPAKAREAIAAKVLADGIDADTIKATPVSAAAQRGIDYLGAEEHWRRIDEKLSQMDRHAFVELAASMASAPSLLDALPSIETRTTILVGAADTPFSKPSARMANRIPGSVLVTIPDAAHCPQYENADAWRTAIDSHLQRCNA
jgi:pimeloyl-ACP methyl ester carboxylesterase